MKPWPALAFLLFLSVPSGAEHVQDGIQWACGPGGGGRGGHPDDCGIDPVGGEGVESVGDPEWGSSWIDAKERVLGVEINGDARAVPVKMLDRHEILNDVIGGVPVAVTYCPLCGSGVTFERRVAFERLAFEVDFAPSGFLYKHDLVMWDPQTDTLWTQITGTPIGTLEDDRVATRHLAASLAVRATAVTTWADWKREHPESTMLQAVPGVRYGDAYAGYSDSCQFGISQESQCDVEGLHPKEEVVGVDGPGGAVAFPYFGMAADGGIAYHAETATVASVRNGLTQAFDAGQHTFHRAGDAWVDEAGRTWDLANGTLAATGDQLAHLDALTMYWFAWNEHHPDTALWLPDSPDAAAKALEDNGKLPGFMVGIVAVMLLAGAWIWRRR